MSTYIAHGDKNTVITTEEKRALLHEALLKLGGIPKKILVIPPDITRLHSNAGELTQILYDCGTLQTARPLISYLPSVHMHR